MPKAVWGWLFTRPPLRKIAPLQSSFARLVNSQARLSCSECSKDIVMTFRLESTILPFLVRIGWLRTAARLPGNLYVVVGVGLHESEMLSLGLAGRSWHNLLGAIRN